LLEARNLFFCDAKLGPDGGYRDRWVRVEAKPIPFYFPNWPARVAAARLHDFHHIASMKQIGPGKRKSPPGKLRVAARVIMRRAFLTLVRSAPG